MKRRHNKENIMNIKTLSLGAVVAAFTFTSYAQSGAAAQLLSPRAQANQIKVLKGMNTDVNPALVCRKTMSGSPKAVAECTSHTTMPGCQTMTVAPLK